MTTLRFATILVLYTLTLFHAMGVFVALSVHHTATAFFYGVMTMLFGSTLKYAVSHREADDDRDVDG